MGAEQNFMNVQAASKQCEVYYGSNVEDQNYYYFWATPMESYLVPVAENRLMRMQANAVQDAYLVEYYDAAYQFQEKKLIPKELELFGGFYATDTNYYIVSGQTNEAESADVECFRITKYDKDWNRISGVGLYDCNTTIPFRAGSVRFAECGKYLLIRTSHEMYADENGVNHQANVTIQVDSEKMEITADEIELSGDDYRYIKAKGNVKGKNIESKMDFVCDELDFDRTTDIAILQGNVSLTDVENDVKANAQYIEYNQKTEVAILQIQINLVQKDNVCTGSYAIYKKNEKLLNLMGNAQVKQGSDTFRAQQIYLNLDTQDITLTGNVKGSVTDTKEPAKKDENSVENAGEKTPEQTEEQKLISSEENGEVKSEDKEAEVKTQIQVEKKTGDKKDE
jgi:lipopolysaccharide export system protein LptA